MQKIILKRNYWYIAIFVAHVALMEGLRYIFGLYVSELSEVKYIGAGNINDAYEVARDKIWTSTVWFYRLLILSLIGITIFLFLNKHRKDINYGEHGSVIAHFAIAAWGISVFLIAFFLEPFYEFFKNNLEDFLKEGKYWWAYYSHFIPHLMLIYYYSIRGFKRDVADNILNKNQSKFDDSITQLEKLKTTGVLSKQEFEEKEYNLLHDKIKTEIKFTEEYSLLQSLKKKGVMTEKEFNQKIEELIKKRIANV